MRSFRLVNGAGEIWPLDGEDGIYFLSPEGLGYNESVSAGKVVNGFSKKTHTEISWPNLTGTLYITTMCDAKSAVKRSSTDNSKDGVYDTYLKFTDFLVSANQLYFDYNPYRGADDSEYARTEVALISIDKSEIVEGDTLQCKMTLARLTPWYYENVILDSEGKTADKVVSIELTPPGRLGAPIDSCFRIELNGNAVPGGITNPGFFITLDEVNEKGSIVRNIAKCNILPFNGGKLVYSSKYNDVVVLRNGKNIMDKVDISQNILLRAKPTSSKNRIILLMDHTSSEGVPWYDYSYKVYRYDYYRSV